MQYILYKLIFINIVQLCVINHKYYNVHGRETPAPTTPYTPKRGRYYSPNYGYEPYWPGGQWVQSVDPVLALTPAPPTVCGKECHYLYRDIKHVCARNIDNTYYAWNWWYYTKLDNLVHGYQTFDTYCEFLDQKCKSAANTRPKFNKWIFVHLGECEQNQDLTFKPMYDREPFTRMESYLEAMDKAFQKLNATPC